MSSQLKQKIKMLESYIEDIEAKNSAFLNHPYYLVLKTYMRKPGVAVAALVGSFAVGYLYSRKKRPTELIYKSVKLPFIIIASLQKIKFLSAFFTHRSE